MKGKELMPVYPENEWGRVTFSRSDHSTKYDLDHLNCHGTEVVFKERIYSVTIVFLNSDSEDSHTYAIQILDEKARLITPRTSKLSDWWKIWQTFLSKNEEEARPHYEDLAKC